MTPMGDYTSISLPVNRRSGALQSATLPELTSGSDDPIVGVRLGHPLAELGFHFLARDLLQAAFAPASLEAWAALLREPPSPQRLAATLAPYAETLRLDHPTTPAFQVRPSAARLEEAAAKKPAGKVRREKAAPDGEEDDEDDAGAMPIAALLPDLPTGEAEKQDTDFFVKRTGVSAIGPAALLPLLYAHMVLFPPGGGGYFGLPHGADSLKFRLLGPTLWHSLWLNVLAAGQPGLEHPRAQEPAGPDDPAVFPWLDPDLPDLPLGRRDEGAAKPMERAALHPFHIPMPRRYLLSPPVPGRCDLTGQEGLVYTSFSRWPKGLQYQPRLWWHPAVSQRTPKKDDEPPKFLRASGPLRLDDWLEIALLEDQNGSPPPGRPQLPSPLAQIRQVISNRSSALTELQALDRRGSALSRQSALPVRVQATGLYLFGKAMGGLSQRELPLWHLDGRHQARLRKSMGEVLDRVGEMAGVLAGYARIAAGQGRADAAGVLPDELRDSLLATLEPQAMDLLRRLVGAARDTDGDPPWPQRVRAERQRFLAAARTEAIAHYDRAFPVRGRDVRMDMLWAEQRGRLIGTLTNILKKEPGEATP